MEGWGGCPPTAWGGGGESSHLIFLGSRSDDSCAVPSARYCMCGDKESQGPCRHETNVTQPGSSGSRRGWGPQSCAEVGQLRHLQLSKNWVVFLLLFFSHLPSLLFPLPSPDRVTKLPGQVAKLQGESHASWSTHSPSPTPRPPREDNK